MEIIGVNHKEERVKKAVITYIDTCYPHLESIMLETPLGYEYFRENGWDINVWFSGIAEHYKSKGVRVIHGDINRWELIKKSPEEILKILQRNPAEYERLLSFGMLKGSFSGRLLRDRNEGLDSMLQQEKPDVTVVGALHGRNLKKRHPEAYFSYFTVPSLPEKLVGWINSGVADKTYLIR